MSANADTVQNPNPKPTAWIELSIETDAELAEAISEALFEHVEGGVSLEQLNTNDRAVDRWEDEVATGPVVVRAYLPKDATLEERRTKVEQALFYLNMVRPIPQPTYKDVAQADWAEAWKVNFKPLRIGKHILIRPSWIPREEAGVQPGDLELSLDPGMAFGTGLHPTTQLCAAALEDQVTPGIRVLDVGSGSGILSVLAAKLGASHVFGVDIEQEAIDAGLENAKLNGVGNVIEMALGSYDQTQERYDLVVANILAGVIRKMLDAGLADRGKRFVFSGILETQTDDVLAAMARAGLTLVEKKQALDWMCLVAEHK